MHQVTKFCLFDFLFDESLNIGQGGWALQMDEENFFDIDSCQFVILSGNQCDNTRLRPYYNQAYSYYKKTWTRIMSHLEDDDYFQPETFLNYTFVTSIFHGDDIAAQMCCRLLHLDNSVTYDLAYFEDFKGPALTSLQRNGAKRLLTFECNSVNPRYSRRRTGFPFVEASLQLCIYLARELNVDCATGVPRRITGVHRVVTDMGFSTVETKIKYGCPVDIVLGYNRSLLEHVDIQVNRKIQELWRKRVDYRKVVDESARTSITSTSLEREA